MNIKLVLEYDGTHYCGYQIQSNGNTVQAELENALKKLVVGDFILYCAGRTDAGVHAKGQVCNFNCESLKTDFENLVIALNCLLPNDISIRNIEKVSDEFNSRYSAKSREYRYTILNSPTRSAFLRYSWHVRDELNIVAMIKASEYLLGSHDFKAFTSAKFEETTIRNMKSVNISKENELVYIDITANAFTRNMVRNIVGTLIEIGRGKRSIEEMQSILNSLDREKAGICAPAKGLCLMRIEY